MTRFKKMTKTQKILLDLIYMYKPDNDIFTYDFMKGISLDHNIRSFDMTFNALLHKGYLKHFATNDFSNKFITTKKFNDFAAII